MKLIMNLPTSENGKKELQNAIDKIKATLIIKAIDDLNLSNENKRKILVAIIDKLEKSNKKEK